MTQLNVIVFSKDRACQLDLLLRSIQEFVLDIGAIRFSILYKSSAASYDQGYEKVKQAFPTFHFVDERKEPGDFKSKLLALIDPGSPLSMFLVDDDLFKAAFSLADDPVRWFQDNPDILCLSLRLGKHIDYCYMLDTNTPAPRFAPGGVWTWQGQPGDWGYPMSLDGHIFRTHEIVPLLRQLVYENPNRLEAGLAAHPLAQTKMNCYPESRIFNLPINKVQQVFNNRSGTVDLALLNERYVKGGLRIRLSPLRGVLNRAPHQEYPIELSK